MPIPGFDLSLVEESRYVLLRLGVAEKWRDPSDPEKEPPPYAGYGSNGNVAGRIIQFQFPPFIQTDNKGGEWKEFPTNGPEPIAVYYGGKTRDISMTWQYVVAGGDWPIKRIERNVKDLRGYYYNFAGAADMVVYFYAYNVAGQPRNVWTFRMTDLSISHNKTLVREPDTGSVYPLKTDVKCTLKFFTTAAGPPQGLGPAFTGEQPAKVNDAPVEIDGVFGPPKEGTPPRNGDGIGIWY